MKKLHYLLASGILLMCVFLMPGPCTRQVSAASYKLSSTSKTIYKGKSSNLTLKNYKSGTISWSSSNKKVVSVKASKTKCVLEALKNGSVTITCKIKKGSTTKKLRCKVKVKTCTHNMATKVLTAATCTSTGQKKTYCKKCGDSTVTTIDALGHDYITSVTPSTCTTKGEKIVYCSRCGYIYSQEKLPYAHNYVNHVCSLCGNKGQILLLFEQLEAIGSEMVSEGWVYSNSGNSINYSGAKSKKNANCAIYITYAMQEAGLLPTNAKIYANSNGKLVVSSKKYTSDEVKNYMKNKGAEFITWPDSSGNLTGKKVTAAGLQEGDIVLWKSHTNVFKGMSDGKYTWYDGGKKSTSDTSNEGGTYEKYIRTGTSGFTSDNKIYGIIRFSED